jgi:branched-chain amino acid transport system permease protein
MSISEGRLPWKGRNWVGVLVLTAFLATLPLWLSTPYALSTLVLIGIYTLVTLGLCLLMGYAGQISLGQAAFFGIGAYGSAILTVHGGWSPWLAMIVAAMGTALIAYLIGIPIFRLRGHYLAMGTLAFGVIVYILLNEGKTLTGGHTGLPGIPRLAIGSLVLKSDLVYYYLVWAFAIVGIIIALNIVNSRFGRALRAIRDSELAAESLGVEGRRYKLQILVVSAVYASVAGSLYAHYMIFVSPSAFDFGVSVRLVLMVAVGGLASIWGAPFGAAAVTLLTLVLREVIPLITRGGSGEYQIVAYGVLLVVIMIFMPEGLTAGLAKAWRRLARGRLAVLRRRLNLRRMFASRRS